MPRCFASSVSQTGLPDFPIAADLPWRVPRNAGYASVCNLNIRIRPLRDHTPKSCGPFWRLNGLRPERMPVPICSFPYLDRHASYVDVFSHNSLPHGTNGSAQSAPPSVRSGHPAAAQSAPDRLYVSVGVVARRAQLGCNRMLISEDRRIFYSKQHSMFLSLTSSRYKPSCPDRLGVDRVVAQ